MSIRPGAPELHIRAAGLILELLGIATVAHGVNETRKFFGHPGIATLLRAWLVRFPKWRRSVVISAGAGFVGITGFSARAYVWTPMDRAAPIDAQVDALTRNVERLKESLLQLQQDLDNEVQKVTTALGEERASRSKDLADVRTRLELAETGGLHIAIVGIIWLCVGVVLTTLSSEIARLGI